MTVGTATLLALGGLVLLYFGGGWVVGKILDWNEPGDIWLSGLVAIAGAATLTAVVVVASTLARAWNQVIL